MNQTEKPTRNDVELSRTGSYNDAAADRPSMTLYQHQHLFAFRRRKLGEDNLGIARASVYRALEAG